MIDIFVRTTSLFWHPCIDDILVWTTSLVGWHPHFNWLPLFWLYPYLTYPGHLCLDPGFKYISLFWLYPCSASSILVLNVYPYSDCPSMVWLYIHIPTVHPPWLYIHVLNVYGLSIYVLSILALTAFALSTHVLTVHPSPVYGQPILSNQTLTAYIHVLAAHGLSIHALTSLSVHSYSNCVHSCSDCLWTAHLCSKCPFLF